MVYRGLCSLEQGVEGVDVGLHSACADLLPRLTYQLHIPILHRLQQHNHTLTAPLAPLA